MEHLLNLLWLLAVLLVLAVARARRNEQLRCSLPVTLGCIAVLALILLPALSMTDDPQRAKLGVETSARDLHAAILPDSLLDQPLQTCLLEAAFPFLMIAVAWKGVVRIPQRLGIALPWLRLSGLCPEAVRPTPAFL